MFPQMDADQAAAQNWDVVIAGSSFSAMFFLRGLPDNLRVLVIEKGPIIPHIDQVSGVPRPQENYAMENLSGHEKTWIAHSIFGGNSNCWWGQVPRFHPSDFRLFETYGVAAPWPISYAELAPFYDEVERVMDVAGGGSEHILPRDSAFPYPAHALSRSDQLCIAERPDIWVPVPTARSNGGRRAICCANGVCHLCPVDAKFSILNGIDDFKRDNVSFLQDAELREVLIEAGQGTGVQVSLADGREQTLKAGLIALGTNAISNAAILLRSNVQSAALGRYLHEQSSRDLELDVAAPGYFGGSAITGHCYGFYDGVHRSDAAAVLLENYNAPNALRPERGRWTERMRIKLIAEDIPQAENRVTLDANGEVSITWIGHSSYATAGLDRAENALSDVLPFELEGITRRRSQPTEAHIQGTHRMGRDPKSSVVNRNSQLHAVSGVYALGSGVFPTSSPANPTLTLSALALLSGRSV